MLRISNKDREDPAFQPQFLNVRKLDAMLLMKIEHTSSSPTFSLLFHACLLASKCFTLNTVSAI